ncbi:Beta-lactamase precursor [Legionella massiliensis]|uniref:Beta-lactamase n=1 Tax=Legionella massiliensis TaxID=1034943 RepID=A0A078KSR3_9GAMM|nr:serine hydrolase [Legionella massiliensis]CDZ77460.1 Beta-lactamase precursor [Legionella massiliensis]CEE13198.1 Beta-lactamase precursor [Legionella massiliensis]
MKGSYVFKAFLAFFVILPSFITSSAQAADAPTVNQLVATVANSFLSDKQIPGAAIAIYYKGQDYYFNFGVANKSSNTPVTQETIFELASITKIFVTTLLAVEVQEGKLRLTDPIVKYLPRLANTTGLPIDQVQVVNLATHTASFPRQLEQFGVKSGNIIGFFNKLQTWQPQTPIGTHYLYSNVSFGLLGNVLVHASAKPLAVLLSENISQPLAMTNTYFTLPANKQALQAQGYRPNGNPAPHYVPANFLGGGALRSSSADMLRFLKANLGVKEENASPQLLSAMQFAQQPQFEVKPQFVLGLGWQRIKHGQQLLITKNGANMGFSTFIGFSPAKQLGVVVLTNKSKGKATMLGNQLLKGLLRL